MEYIKFILTVLFVIGMYIAITKICMWVAAYIGEKLGIGKFLIYLFWKNKNNENQF
jgi:hypothetical protein